MRKAVLIGCVVLSVVLASIPAQGVESLVLYDDFTAKLIDPDKWSGRGTGGTEGLRQIQGGRLHLVSRGYGDTTSDTGRRGSSLGVNFSKPATVTAIAATVQVKKFQATGCAIPGSASTMVRIDLGGSYFNAGTPTPGSSLNDVRARIRLERLSTSTDTAKVLRVRGIVFQCTTADCSTSTSLGSNDFGPINAGETVKLRIQWDPDNNRFIFQRDTQPEVLLSYSVSDTAPVSNLFQFVQVSHDVANCTAEPRPVAFMDVLIDDVFVNASAATVAEE